MLEIIELIKKEKRREALKDLNISSYLMQDLFQELQNRNMHEEIIKMFRVAASEGYISFNSAKLKG